MSARKEITVAVHARFIAAAERIGVTPEYLAQLACDEIAYRNPSGIVIVNQRDPRLSGARSCRPAVRGR